MCSARLSASCLIYTNTNDGNCFNQRFLTTTIIIVLLFYRKSSMAIEHVPEVNNNDVSVVQLKPHVLTSPYRSVREARLNTGCLACETRLSSKV